MSELMIHVERIVRPVRAFQSTKLKMRRELLNHLQAAVDEEQTRGAGESQAIEIARQRLGDPAEMTASLQRSVPALQRFLLAKFPLPGALYLWEKRCDDRFRFMRHLTLWNAMILVGGVAAVSIAGLGLSARPLMVDHSALAGDAAFNARIGITLAWLLANAVAVAGAGFVAVASARRRQFWRRVIGFALIIICTQLLWTLVISKTFGGGHTLTAIDWMTSLCVGLGMVVSMSGLARLLARLRRPYDQWLMLDIAQ